MKEDFLDEIVAERTKKNPNFPNLVEEAAARRALARSLARFREQQELSQTYVAAQMRTSASVVSKLERGGGIEGLEEVLGERLSDRPRSFGAWTTSGPNETHH